ncbi:NUDIX domain-containing protein [Streptomyces otsuchiensis]|uniref:NUDIX domain-containing protein n=1 Tax=Streptomyces otsuchiensis TaxID=2681388 RepID=UPI00102FE0BA|nr:NUDIX domain-containing protein [Streptomyces otsuchiensis]
MDEDELLDVVDESDRVTGRARRGAVYRDGLRHRCTAVLVTDGHDRIFVHRRTARKLIFPSHYDMFVGGVVGSGESYDDAALREAEEELGVRGLPRPEPVLRFLYEEADRSWWTAVYRVRCTLPVRPRSQEIDWHTFLTAAELEEWLPRRRWTPDGLAAYRRLSASRTG